MSKRILIYGIGLFFSKILVFLMVPIYTRVFSVADYGYYDVVIQNMQMVVSISFLEIWSGILRYIFDGTEKLRPINTLKKMFPVLLFFYAVAFSVLCRLTDVKYVSLTLLYGLTYLLFSVSNSVCRGYGNNLLYVLSGLISTVTACGLSIFFAVGLRKTIEYLIISQCVGYVIASAFVELKLRCFIRSFQTKEMIPVRQMTLYCFPLMLNSFSFLFLGTYNKNAVLMKLGEVASGYYAYVSKFSSILSILISIYTLAWQEEAFSSAGQANQDEKYTHYINLFARMIGLGAPVFTMMLFWGAGFIGGAQYTAAAEFIPLTILGAYVAGLSSVYSSVLAVDKRTHHIFFSTIVGAVANVLLVTIFIERTGINGANMALCLGFAATALTRYAFSKQKHRIKIDVVTDALALLEMIVCFVVFQSHNQTAAGAAFIAMSFIWSFRNRHEIRQIIRKAMRQDG